MKLPRDKTKEIMEEAINIPEHAQEDFNNLLQAIYTELLKPMPPRIQRQPDSAKSIKWKVES
jgi:hypothetical protein